MLPRQISSGPVYRGAEKPKFDRFFNFNILSWRHLAAYR